MYASCPPTLTVTPSSVVGSTPFTTELFQLSVTVERLAPLMVSHAFGTMPDAKLAPFSASVMTTLVRTPTANASDWLLAPPIERTTGRLPLWPLVRLLLLRGWCHRLLLRGGLRFDRLRLD